MNHSFSSLTGDFFFFGLSIIDRIKSPIDAVISRLYYDNGINSAPMTPS
jgi:hypothetical protein